MFLFLRWDILVPCRVIIRVPFDDRYFGGIFLIGSLNWWFLSGHRNWHLDGPFEMNFV